METELTSPDTNPTQTANPNTSSMWSSIVKKDPAETKSPATHHGMASAALGMVGNCNSTKGITMAVIDANAVIEGGQNLSSFADKFVTVPEVLSEIRDPVSRRRLAFIPFTIDAMEPSPESLNKVIKFAKETGDLQTLSDVDLKLIALTYTLEAQIHGTKYLRDVPPPIHTVKVKRLPEKELPGWGSNVPNLAEWEALENETEDKSNSNSRILPLKDLNMNIVSSDNCSEAGSVATNGDSRPEHQEEDEQGRRRYRRYPPKKKEINIEGKKMVAEGVDASQGQHEDDGGDWKPAVSRSTHRRYLRRKARREYYGALAEQELQQDQDNSPDGNVIEQSSQISDDVNGRGGADSGKNDDELSSILKQLRLEEDSLRALQEGPDEAFGENENENGHDFEIDEEGGEASKQGLDNMEEISSEAEDTTVEASSAADDDGVSEQSWTLRALSESSVACITGDYAMQNVILQMGLRLLAPGGMQIRQLHRWILKCHACYTVTYEIGRIFCPKCGNGGTLRKVAVTIGENGTILASRKPRIILRGTKFSLPLPQGGRGAIAKNPVLREDQLPQKFLYPKTKKKGNKKGDEFFTADDVFMHHNDKKAPLRPPVRKALAVFSQRRNPNDNHYSRSSH
ncbi:PREDICTED: RNA-binding protein NOB1 [Tarenaya hassleriana]|uniref:RNA-binding protein NOB1 n=1 Tax=Tarenaya hassleriana TaxID=28532 RepID=UPI00053C9051|nr:PREDICTED: RNA-binding protein NOB1 [Tarenaya hassleriana]